MYTKRQKAIYADRKHETTQPSKVNFERIRRPIRNDCEKFRKPLANQNEDGSPPHHEARTVKLKMEDKMVRIKKTTSALVHLLINSPWTTSGDDD